MEDQKDLPKPETELPKPEEDLPLPEKEITSGNETPVEGKVINDQNSNPANGNMNGKAILAIILLIFLYPIGVILMWFGTRWPKWVKIILTIPFVLGILGLIAGVYFLSKIASNDLSDDNFPTPVPDEQVVCTMEAKLCPDGVTYVSRQAPTCEFAKCPETSESTPSANMQISPESDNSSSSATDLQ